MTPPRSSAAAGAGARAAAARASSTGRRRSSPGAAASRCCSRTTTCAKLLRKGAVYSRTTTWVFRAGPVVGLAAVLVAAALVPLGGVAGAARLPGRSDPVRLPARADAVLHRARGARHRLELRGHGRQPRGDVRGAGGAGAAARAGRRWRARPAACRCPTMYAGDRRRRVGARRAGAGAGRPARCWSSSSPRTRASRSTIRTRTSS